MVPFSKCDCVKISIIIPVLNESGRVVQAVDRAWASGADQVIVVDGGSTDSTCDELATTNCQSVASPPGRAVQMNRGANQADGEVLLFLHADNWLVENACDQIREALVDSTIAFGAFRQRIENRHRIYRWIESGNAMRVNWQGLIYGDQAFFIRSQLFELTGRFPELELMEDFAYSRSLRKVGKPVLLEGPTFVSARRWESTGPLRQTMRNWWLSLAFRGGASPGWIASRYRRHDQS